MKSLCILIPYYNKEDSIAEVLQALNEYSPKPCKVLLLIDGCNEPSLPTYNKLILSIINNQTNQGLSYSRNKLLNHCQEEYIVFLDADAVIYPDFFSKLYPSLENHEVIAGQEFSSPNHGVTNRFRSIFWKQTHGEHSIEDCPFLMGICFAGKRTEFLNENGFNLSFNNFGEDVEFSLRYLKKSKIFYNSELKVHHLRNDSLKSMIQMINNHNKFFIKAHFFHKIKLTGYIKQSFKWILICAYSSLFRHKSLSLAIVSLFYNLFSAINRSYHLLKFKDFDYDKY